jgi:hypothetical protein
MRRADKCEERLKVKDLHDERGCTLYKEEITGSLQSVLLLCCSVPSA